MKKYEQLMWKSPSEHAVEQMFKRWGQYGTELALVNSELDLYNVSGRQTNNGPVFFSYSGPSRNPEDPRFINSRPKDDLSWSYDKDEAGEWQYKVATPGKR